jgi:hypothetical protein
MIRYIDEKVTEIDALTYERGIQIIKSKDGRLHFRPSKNLTKEEHKEIESL